MLELFERDALRLGRFFQVFHGFRVHLFAQLIKTLDYVGIGADSQFVRLLRQQPRIDEVTQHIFFLGPIIGRHGRIDFLALRLQLFFTALKIGERDDAVVDADDDLFHDGSVVRLAVRRSRCDRRRWNRSAGQGRLRLLPDHGLCA